MKLLELYYNAMFEVGIEVSFIHFETKPDSSNITLLTISNTDKKANLCNVFLTFECVNEFLKCSHQLKATERHFPVVLGTPWHGEFLKLTLDYPGCQRLFFSRLSFNWPSSSFSTPLLRQSGL